MTDWTEVEAIWTEVAAICAGSGALITAVTMAFIAWQASETRKTAKATADSVEISRKSLGISQAMETNSTKSRLDERAPKLLVAPEFSAEDKVTKGIGSAEEFPEWHELRHTRDDGQRLATGAGFVITNEGDRSVEVYLKIEGEISFVEPADSDVPRESYGKRHLWLAPKGSCRFRISKASPLVEWINAWEAHKNGDETLSRIFCNVSCSDPYDEGVIDKWICEVYCYPVSPSEDDVAAWIVRNRYMMSPPPARGSVIPQQREYFLSKQADERLVVSNQDLPR